MKSSLVSPPSRRQNSAATNKSIIQLPLTPCKNQQQYKLSLISSKLIKTEASDPYISILFILDMTDYLEVIRNLQSELEQAKDEIKRRDKQIETLKKTNKTHENHAEVLRKKLTDMEGKRTNVPTEEDPRIQEMTRSIDRLNNELGQQQKNNIKLSQSLENLRKETQSSEKVRRENSSLKEMVEKLKKEIYQLNSLVSQSQRGGEAPKAQMEQLKKEIQSLKQERQKDQQERQKERQEREKEQRQLRSTEYELKMSSDKWKNASDRYDSQLKQKQKRIAEYEKKITALEKSNKSMAEMQRKSQIMEQVPQSNSQIVESVTESSKIEFYEGVPLTDSLNEDHLIIPTTHERLFSVFNTYVARLMPNQQVKFLNLIIADSQNKLERIEEVLLDFE